MSVENLEFMKEKEKFALLFGIMLGDGCLSHYSCKDGKKKREIVIVGHKYNNKDFFENILVPLLKSLTRNSVKIKERKDCAAIAIHVRDKELFNRIKSSDFPIGKKGTSLFIPKVFL